MKAYEAFDLENQPLIPITSLYQTGIYFLYKADKVVYIGQSTDIASRITTHISEGKKKFDSVRIYIINPQLMNEAEKYFIKKYNPMYNFVHNTIEIKEQLIQDKTVDRINKSKSNLLKANNMKGNLIVKDNIWRYLKLIIDEQEVFLVISKDRLSKYNIISMGNVIGALYKKTSNGLFNAGFYWDNRRFKINASSRNNFKIVEVPLDYKPVGYKKFKPK